MPTKVLIIDPRDKQYRAHLEPRFPSVVFLGAHDEKDALAAASDVEVIVGLDHHIPRSVVATAPNLKWVQALTTGTDSMGAPGVLPKHVVLTSTRGVHGPQMSELALLTMIALQRDFRRMQRNQAEGKWDQWGQPILQGKTIVIVGLGLLAEHLAARCKLFGMTTIGVSSGRGQAPHFDEVMSRGELAKAAARADFLLLLVPSSPATHHLINRDVIAAMKPSAFLINLARGGVLDEEALIEALRASRIAGGAADVFAKQPLPADHPFWTMPNFIVYPNIGGRSDCFVEQTLTVLEPNMAAYVEGRLKDLRNVVPH
jgi:phosphoglycerate dehydrogenase-like enzyme